MGDFFVALTERSGCVAMGHRGAPGYRCKMPAIDWVVMPENHLTAAWVNYGLSPVSSRRALRDMVEGLIGEGPGAALGVHDVGVFYAMQARARFVVRDGKIFQVPARTVVKLRPRKSVTTELDESPDVRISFQFGTGSEGAHSFHSTSRANQFEADSPSNIDGDTWRLVYSKIDGIAGYGFGVNTLTDSEIANITDYRAGVVDDVDGVRIEHSLTTIIPRTAPGDSSFGFVTVSAEVEDGTLEFLSDGTYGREVSAHFRQRALTLL